VGGLVIVGLRLILTGLLVASGLLELGIFNRGPSALNRM
jgi:hypothetical protein